MKLRSSEIVGGITNASIEDKLKFFVTRKYRCVYTAKKYEECKQF